MKIQVTQTLPNGQVTQQVLSKDGAEVLKIQAQPGAKISFNVEGAKPADAANAKAKTGNIKKSGNNLVLESEGEQLVQVTDFYSTAGASVGDVGWNYAAADAGVTAATPEAQALSSDAAVSESGALFPAIAPGWLVAGGAATVAAVASGGGSGVASLLPSTTTVVSGVITAGQLVAGHGLTVQFYKKDGVTLLGTPVSVDATGHFTATLSVGSGEAIIAKVIDASNGNDFKDEATNANKDLNAALMTVGVSNGGSLVLNINPLTTIAAQKAGLSADGLTGSVADAATATSANAAVAKAFGVADITTTTPDVTNDGAFDNTTAAGKIGAVLAAISGADLANGGNAQTTIDALTLAVNTTTGTLTTAQQTVLAQGAAVAEAGSGVTGVVGALSSALAAQNGSVSVSIANITADNILNAAETTTDIVSHTTKITGTNAAGATVVLVFGSSPAVPMNGTVTPLTATTWEYVVTSTDITNLGADGGHSVTATATLTGGATAAATRVFVLNAVNDAPLVAASSVGLVDTAAADTFANQVGTLSAVDPEGTTPLTYGITGGAAGATVGGVVYDVSKVGTYGTLYVKSTTGEYVFVANATAVNHVSANTTETFAVTASDGSLSGANNLFVTITGANDTPVLVAPTAIALTDTAAVDTFANQTGTLSASDAEGTALTYGITGSSAGATVGGIVYEVSKVGTYGTLYVKATGEYVYVANAPAINHASANATDTFAVTASDGTQTGSNTLTVNITGANDTPVVVAPTAIALVDTAVADTFANQTGTLSASDAEGTALTYGITGSAAGATVGGVVYDVSKVGTYGTLYVKATGEYVYVANATAINHVSANTTDTFAVTASDGTQTGGNTLTVNITGANDTPVVVAPTAIALVDTAAADTFANQTGTLSASDPEGTALTYGITGSAAGATVGGVVYDVSKVGTYGTLYVKSTTGEYVFVANAAAVNAVSANTTEAFTVTASDGVATGNNMLNINVTGANDRPVLASNFGVHTTPIAGDNDYVSLIIGQSVPSIVNASSVFTDVDTGHAAMTFSLLSVDGVTGGSISGVTFHSDGTITGAPTDVAGTTYPKDYTVVFRAYDGNNSALYTDHALIFHMLKAPAVQSFAVVDNNAGGGTDFYTGKSGDTLTFSVVFSELVTVDTTGGTPSIDFTLGGNTITANYSAGTGSNTLTFIANATSTTGSATSATLANVNLHGGTVMGNQSSQPWSFSTVGQTASYTLDNTAPTLATTNYSIAESTGASMPSNVAIATLAGSDTSALTYAMGSSGADNSLFALSTGGVLMLNTGKSFENIGMHANTYNVTVDITDAAGNLLDEKAITVNLTDVNEAPQLASQTANVTNAVTGEALTSIAAGSAFTDPDTLTASFHNMYYDLSATLGGNAVSLATAGLSIDHATGNITGTPSASGVYGLTVTAWDGGAASVGLSASETFNLTAAARPALASTETLDNVTNLDVRSPIVLKFSEDVNLGSGHIVITKDTGWTFNNYTTSQTMTDSAVNTVDITLTSGVVTDMTVGGVHYGSLGTSGLSLSQLQASVSVDHTNHTLVINPGGADSLAPTGWHFDWDLGSTYHTTFEAGIVTSVASGVSNAAMSSATTLNFGTVTPTTEAGTLVGSTYTFNSYDVNGAISQMMSTDDSIATNAYWHSGNVGKNTGANVQTLNFGTHTLSDVLVELGMAGTATTLNSQVGGKVNLNGFGTEDAIYLDNFGNTSLATVDGLQGASWGGSGNTTVRTQTAGAGSTGGNQQIAFTDMGTLHSTWTAISSLNGGDSTFENSAHYNANAIIFG